MGQAPPRRSVPVKIGDNLAMVSGTFRRNMYNVQKWPGSGPLDLTPDDTPSAWLEGTEPEPTDPVE